MRAVNVLSVVIAMGGIGVSIGSPRLQSYTVLGADFTNAVVVGDPKGTARSPASGTLDSMHWETNTPGVGIGAFTLAAQVDDVDVCVVERACSATGSSDVTCSTSVAAGADVHVTITASSCIVLPAGMASVWLRLSQ